MKIQFTYTHTFQTTKPRILEFSQSWLTGFLAILFCYLTFVCFSWIPYTGDLAGCGMFVSMSLWMRCTLAAIISPELTLEWTLGTKKVQVSKSYEIELRPEPFVYDKGWEPLTPEWFAVRKWDVDAFHSACIQKIRQHEIGTVKNHVVKDLLKDIRDNAAKVC